MIYLDYQAATPVWPEALAAMEPYWRQHFGSTSSLHHFGLEAREALAQARDQFAHFLNAELAEEIIFTSSGTEAANLAIKGYAEANQVLGSHLIISAAEHPAVLRSCTWLETLGFRLTVLPVDQQGFLDPEAVRAAIQPDTILIATHLANHDLGTIQAVEKIVAIAREKSVAVFCDAVSAAGWLKVDVQALGVDLLSVSPARFYGPKGVGVLYRRRTAKLAPLIHGGEQEEGYRGGQVNLPAIVGAGVVAERSNQRLTERVRQVGALQLSLYEGLKQSIPHVVLNGPPPGISRVSHSLHLSFEFIEAEALVLRADLHGLIFTAGTGCVSRAWKISPALKAIGLDHRLALGSILLSLGEESTVEEVAQVVKTLPKIVQKIRESSPLWQEFLDGKIKSVADEMGKT
jgi:cysteine desulfurase